MKNLFKKSLTILLASSIIIASVFANEMSVLADSSEKSNGVYNYTENSDGTITINKYVGTALSVNIPASIDGGTITAIGSFAFESCTSITDISIPESVTTIGSYAFSGCSGLTGISVPESVTKINTDAFDGCTFASIFIPKSVTYCEFAFGNMPNLKSVTLEDGAASVPDFFLDGCKYIQQFTVPNSVTTIGSYAFSGCSSLTGISIPESVTKINEDAFDGCTFTSIFIPKSVASCGFAFGNMPNLKSVTLEDGAASVPDFFLDGCKYIQQFTVPNSVTTIGSYAFSGCSSLTGISIPESVTKIGMSAFSGCSFSNISIPKSVTSSCDSFQGFTNLNGVSFENGMQQIPDFTLSGATGLQTVYIPSGMTQIGSYAFSGDTALSSIYIPSTVTQIKMNAFDGCKNLKAVYFGGPTLPANMGTNVFNGCPTNIQYYFNASPPTSLAAMPQEYIDPPTIPANSYWADPVNTASGSHNLSIDAISVTGAQKLDFNLSYDSTRLSAGSMGRGWYSNYDMQLQKMEDGSLRVFWSPSSYATFSEQGTTAEYLCSDYGKQNDVLQKNTDGTFTLQEGSKLESYTFGDDGSLVKIQTKTGFVTDLSKDQNGNLIITEPVSGKTLTVEYGSNGLVSRVCDQTGRAASFTYGSNNDLISIIDTNGKTNTYSYDEFGRVLTGVDGDGVLCFADSYDVAGRVIRQRDASGNYTYFSYDTTSVSGQTTVYITDRNGNMLQRVFNDKRQLVSEKDQNGIIKSYTYDGNGNVASEADGNGGTISNTYDSQNDLLTTTDQTGSTTVYTYDANKNMLTQTNPDGGIITNTYDENNRLASTTDTLGKKTSYTYDKNGLPSPLHDFPNGRAGKGAQTHPSGFSGRRRCTYPCDKRSESFFSSENLRSGAERLCSHAATEILRGSKPPARMPRC